MEIDGRKVCLLILARDGEKGRMERRREGERQREKGKEMKE